MHKNAIVPTPDSTRAVPEEPEFDRLSDMLRERTKALHVQAERSGIVNDILRGQASRNSYALLMRNLLPAYESMEAILASHQRTPGLRAFARPELYRSDALCRDLDGLCGSAWREALPVLPEARTYAERIRAAGENGGLDLIGHAYARYFGDLSGGLILSRLLGKSLSLGPETLTFYVFPGIADPGRFKDACRQSLDDDILDATDKAAIIAEALTAFSCNITLSEAVQRADPALPNQEPRADSGLVV